MSGPGDPAGPSVAALRQALALHRGGRLEEAERIYGAVLAREPANPAALYLAGLAAAQRGRDDDAVRRLAAALEADPAHDDARFQLANALQRAGRAAEAAAAYETLLARRPADARARNNLAVARLAADDVAGARAACRAALVAEPAYAEAANTLGTARLADERPRDAARAYRRCLALAPHHLDARLGLADALAAAGRADAAAAAYRAVLLAEPGQPAALLGLGHVVEAAGPEAAGHAWRRLLAVRPGHERAVQRLALLLDHEGRREAAAALVMAALGRRRGPGTRPAADELRRSSRTKLRHDAEQRARLARRGALPAAFEALAAEGAALAARAPAGRPVDLAALRPPPSAAFLAAHNRLHHVAAAPALTEGALDPAIDWRAVAASFAGDGFHATAIDGLLTPAAQESVLRFCRESTIWVQARFAHEVGARFVEGLCAPILLQVAAELRAALPGILGGLRLRTLFGYMYYQSGADGHPHADQGLVSDRRAVSLNYWPVPDAANLDPASGGLEIWNRRVGPAYFRARDAEAKRAMIEAALASPGTERRRIAYAGNRAMLFRSDVVHKSEPMTFRDDLDGRRLSLTFVWGAP